MAKAVPVASSVGPQERPLGAGRGADRGDLFGIGRYHDAIEAAPARGLDGVDDQRTAAERPDVLAAHADRAGAGRNQA